MNTRITTHASNLHEKLNKDRVEIKACTANYAPGCDDSVVQHHIDIVSRSDSLVSLKR